MFFFLVAPVVFMSTLTPDRRIPTPYRTQAFPVAMWPFRSCVLGIYLRVTDGIHFDIPYIRFVMIPYVRFVCQTISVESITTICMGQFLFVRSLVSVVLCWSSCFALLLSRVAWSCRVLSCDCVLSCDRLLLSCHCRVV